MGATKLGSNKINPHVGLTLRSTRTPPALSVALSQPPSSSAPLCIRPQAWPVSSVSLGALGPSILSRWSGFSLLLRSSSIFGIY